MYLVSLLTLAGLAAISCLMFVLAYRKQIRLETELIQARNSAESLKAELEEARNSAKSLEVELQRAQDSAENRVRYIAQLEGQKAFLKLLSQKWEWTALSLRCLMVGLRRDVNRQRRQITALMEKLPNG